MHAQDENSCWFIAFRVGIQSTSNPYTIYNWVITVYHISLLYLLCLPFLFQKIFCETIDHPSGDKPWFLKYKLLNKMVHESWFGHPMFLLLFFFFNIFHVMANDWCALRWAYLRCHSTQWCLTLVLLKKYCWEFTADSTTIHLSQRRSLPFHKLDIQLLSQWPWPPTESIHRPHAEN